jgi:hypothetical protein
MADKLSSVIACMHASPTRGRPIGDHLRGTYMPVEKPSTASEGDVHRKSDAQIGRSSLRQASLTKAFGESVSHGQVPIGGFFYLS